MVYVDALGRLAGAAMGLSVMAFSYAGVAALHGTTECYAKYDDVCTDVLGGIWGLDLCEKQDCKEDCVLDFVLVSSSYGHYLKCWCECGGEQDGEDSNEHCHAIVHYGGQGGEDDIVDLEFELKQCVKPCVDGGACINLEPAGGYVVGMKLCGCD